MRSKLAKHPLLAYFLLAFGIAWLGWLPAAAVAQWWPAARLSNPLAALSPFAFGPTLAGFIVVGATDGRQGMAQLLRRFTRWRLGLRWYLVALASPAAVFATAGLLRGAAGGAPLDLALAPVRTAYPQVNPLAILPVALLTGLLIGPLNEEFGWRGLALPRLQERFSPFTATLLLGLLWGVWHLPLFFITGMTQATQPFGPFLLSVMVNSFFYTWLFNATGGSVLLAVLLHDTFNTTSAFIPVLPTEWQAIAVAAATVLAFVIPGRAAWFRSPGATGTTRSL